MVQQEIDTQFYTIRVLIVAIKKWIAQAYMGKTDAGNMQTE
jgi:hypothetical protein